MCSKRRGTCRLICDVALGVAVCVTYLTVVRTVAPHSRGFFCDDESIKYPYHTSTVQSWMLLVFCLVIVPATIALTESYYVKRRLRSVHPTSTTPSQLSVRAGDVISSGGRTTTGSSSRCNDVIRSRNYASSSLRQHCCRLALRSAGTIAGLFLFGLAVTMLVTEVGKLTIGRLRPHFFAVCRPDFAELNCSQGYVEEFRCASDASPTRIQEARKSFPSGHSSMAVYVAVFLAYYLRRRLATDRTVLLKLVLDLCLCSLATFTCLSRVTDNMHHWSDVLAGAVLGLATGVWMIAFMRQSVTWDLFQPTSVNVENLNQSLNSSAAYNIQTGEEYNVDDNEE